MDWKEFLRREVFIPLQMKDTNLKDALKEQQTGRLARGYAPSELAFTPSPQSLRRGFSYGLGWDVTTGSGSAQRNPMKLYIEGHEGELEGFSTVLRRARRRVPRCQVSVAILCNSVWYPGFRPEVAADQILEIYCPL